MILKYLSTVHLCLVQFLSKKAKNCSYPLHFIFLQDCFEIGKSSGLLTWVGEIPKETIKTELVQFDVVAYQQSNEDKQISHTVIITFPGDKNGVNFTQSEYQASLTWVSIEYTYLLSTIKGFKRPIVV